MIYYWHRYLAKHEDGDSPYASVLRAADLRGLPPALIQTAEYDPLRDEGEAYAHRLHRAGVPIRLIRYLGMPHGFLRFAATVGGAPAQVVRYLLRQNNMKPDSDVRFAAVGAGQARVNALKNGQVDMIVGGIPDTEQPELEGWGYTLIRLGGEIEIFKDYPHESVHALDTYIKAHPDYTRSLLRAIARGNNLIIDNPAESDDLLVKQFPKIDPSVLKTVMSHSRSTFRRNLRNRHGLYQSAFCRARRSQLGPHRAGRLSSATRLPGH